MGLIKILFSTISIVIALFLTALLTPIVSNSLKNNKDVYAYFEKIVIDFTDLEGKELKDSGEQEKFIKELNLPSSLTNTLVKNNSMEVYKEKGVTEFQDYIVNSIVGLIINAIAFIIVYLIVRIIILIVGRILDVISKMPILKNINKNVGIVVGFAQGLLIIWLLFVVIFICANTAVGESALTCVQQSMILSYLYKNNLLINLSTLFF